MGAQKKALDTKKCEGLLKGKATTYFSTVKTAVSLALAGLTTLFGKGRGVPRRHSHLKLINKIKGKSEDGGIDNVT